MVTNKLKIVIDARMINMSGIGRYIQALIPDLVQHSSILTLLGKKIDIDRFSWANNVKIVEMANPIYSISEQVNLFLKTPKCDIFISPHYNVPILLPQSSKIAVIIPDTNHLIFAKEFSFLKRSYAKFFYNAAVKKDVIFTISEFSKSEIIRLTNCEVQQITVAKCAIDKEYFKGMLKNIDTATIPNIIKKYKDEKYILFIGNIKPHKNLKRALLAFNKLSLAFPDLKFLIVGKKDNFLHGDDEVFDLVSKDENMTQKVEFTGHISDLYLCYLYKNAQLFLFPSLYEGFGLPPLEAMFFGCPVLVSKEGSLPEICGEAACYCDAYDQLDIANQIEKLLLDSVLRKSIIEKGYKKVEEYDWSTFTNIIIGTLLK